MPSYLASWTDLGLDLRTLERRKGAKCRVDRDIRRVNDLRTRGEMEMTREIILAYPVRPRTQGRSAACSHECGCSLLIGTEAKMADASRNLQLRLRLLALIHEAISACLRGCCSGVWCSRRPSRGMCRRSQSVCGRIKRGLSLEDVRRDMRVVALLDEKLEHRNAHIKHVLACSAELPELRIVLECSLVVAYRAIELCKVAVTHLLNLYGKRILHEVGRERHRLECSL